jgi:hypothetical protein
MKFLVALIALAATASCQKFGPRGRIIEFEEIDCYTGDVVFIADKSNLCWFWQCKANKEGIFSLIPRRCALGSKMPSSYISGKDNPCQINFNKEIDFDCTRTEDPTALDFEPACFAELDCKNNGTAVYSDNICWCDCPAEWQGASDCSEETELVYMDLGDVGGIDEENCFYDNPPCDQVDGCENGGVCHNQCKDFWCECPTPFTRGKRCEQFDCETSPCMNGGTCNRGQNDQDEVNECLCTERYTGLLCENEIEGDVEFEPMAVETSANETSTDV